MTPGGPLKWPKRVNKPKGSGNGMDQTSTTVTGMAHVPTSVAEMNQRDTSVAEMNQVPNSAS